MTRLQKSMALLGASVFVVSLLLLGQKIGINASTSIEPVVFWLEDDSAPLMRGDYVFFPLQHPELMQGQEMVLIKRIACLPLETVTRDRGSWTCNGLEIGQDRNFDPPRLQLPLVLQPGEFFLVGDHNQSFDSRIFGPVAHEKIFAHSRHWL